MFVIGQLLASLAYLFNMIFNVIYFLLVIRIILSWFSINPYSEITQILFRITEPILAPFRKLPLQAGFIDFSPILAFMVLWFARSFIVGILSHYAMVFMR
ncbi:MAG: YggT family protein [Candidatus Omnitrophica bacterium]|nr:YggT family protein [Candidatus Omnitrophota bacterium]